MSSGYKILLIDDDDDLVEALTTILEVKGYIVGRASNGKEGLKALEKNELPLEIEVHKEMYPVDLFMEKPVAPEKFISEIKNLIDK